MLSPVHSLGPGERVGLWLQGCARSCPGCISPELQPVTGSETEERLLADILLRTASIGKCRGLTVSGGEPFLQADALLRLLELVRDGFEDILVYTGYTLEELRRGDCGPAGAECLDRIDVLIDGPYIRERNRPDCVLRGSDNQTIHYLDPEAAGRYGVYLARGRILESFSHDGAVILTGIPDRRDET